MVVLANGATQRFLERVRVLCAYRLGAVAIRALAVVGQRLLRRSPVAGLQGILSRKIRTFLVGMDEIRSHFHGGTSTTEANY